MKTIDRDKLETLMDKAKDARETWWNALETIEKYIGCNFDELDITSDDAMEYDADGLLVLLGDTSKTPVADLGEDFVSAGGAL